MKLSHNDKVVLQNEYRFREQVLESDIYNLQYSVDAKREALRREEDKLDLAKKYLKWHQAVPESVIFNED